MFYSSKNLFGCIGIQKQEYCILNKKYSKKEYEKLIPKIIKHMNDMPYIDKKGRVYKYGEFFPSELSFFGYNETLAYSYFPLSKEEAEEKGLNWTEIKINKHEIKKKSSELPDNIKDVDDSILNEVIEDEESGRPYKIVEKELKILRRLNVPLPRRHYNERHYLRVSKRNPLKLWKRQCMCDKKNHFHNKEKCIIEFKTSYPPERAENSSVRAGTPKRHEIVYCEKCYQQEIY